MIEQLFYYLDEIKDKRFRWGKHDCFTFTNEAWRRMYGAPWADAHWTGSYLDPYALPVTVADLRARFPAYRDVAAAVDLRLRRVPYTPPRGALVAVETGEGSHRLGLAFGIVTGVHAAFLAARGVRYVHIEDITHAWVNRK